MLLGRRWRLARRGQLPDHERRRREALELPGRDRAGVIDRTQGLDGPPQRDGARPAAAPHRRPLRHDAARRRAVGRRRPDAGGEARDRPRARRGRDRPHRGGLPARLGGGLARGRADQRRRPAGRDLGLLARRAGGRRGARRARRAGVGDREPDLRREARRRSASRTRRCSSGFAARSRSRPAPGSRSRSSASTPRGPSSTSTGAPTRPRSRPARRRSSSSTRSGSRRPEAAAYLVGQTVDWLGGEIPVHWHGHDDFGLGTAAAIAAVQAGATWVQGTINGMGERAGNADLLEVALALEALYGIPTRLDLTQARALSQLVQRARRHAAAVVEGRHRRRALHARVGRGRGAVPRSAGDRALQLRARRRRRAGSCSARRAGSTRSRSPRERLGLDVPEERRADLLAAVKQLGTEKGGLVSDDEFAALVAELVGPSYITIY